METARRDRSWLYAAVIIGLAVAAAAGATLALPALVIPVPAAVLVAAIVVAIVGGYMLGPSARPSGTPVSGGRLDRVASAARALADGHLDIRLPPGGEDEVGRIATALEEIRQTLRAELQMRDHLGNIVDHLDVAVLLLAPDGKVTQANSAALTLFEREVDTVLGGSIFGLLEGAADSAGDADVIARLGGHGTVIRPIGDPVPVSIHATEIEGPGGREIVCVLRDIGEEHARSEATRAALEQVQAVQRMKSQFLDNMSHELRTPLNAIIGLSEMFALETFGPLGHEKYKTYAQKIHESGTHLLASLSDILQIAKIDGGSETLVIEPASPLELAKSALSLVEDRAWESGVALGFVNDEGLPETIEIDEAAVKSMLVHLLKNALQHTPAGGAATLMVQADDQSVSFVVEDMGQGMTEASIEEALTPFRQVNEDHNRRTKEGIGLGLPLARHITELHGGEFAIESEPEVHTRVTVRLPIARVTRKTRLRAA